jgi:hypothetical protein
MWAERGKARPAHAHSARRPRPTAARTAAPTSKAALRGKKDVAKAKPLRGRNDYYRCMVRLGVSERYREVLAATACDGLIRKPHAGAVVPSAR